MTYLLIYWMILRDSLSAKCSLYDSNKYVGRKIYRYRLQYSANLSGCYQNFFFSTESFVRASCRPIASVFFFRADISVSADTFLPDGIEPTRGSRSHERFRK